MEESMPLMLCVVRLKLLLAASTPPLLVPIIPAYSVLRKIRLNYLCCSACSLTKP